MIVQQAPEFVRWLNGLRDQKARTMIVRRLNKIEVDDHLGAVRSVGQGISEIKIDYGPGYRLYFTRRASTVIVLLLAGDKDSQARDILKAQRVAAQLA